MTHSNRISRRRFFQRSAATVVPYFISAGVLAAPGRPGANDRVIIGFVGTGGRARQLMDHVPADGRIVAICDCYRRRTIDTLNEKKASSAEFVGEFWLREVSKVVV